MLTATQVRTVTDVEFPVTDTYVSVTPGDGDGLFNFGEPNTHILVTGPAPVTYQGVTPTDEQMSLLVGRVIAVRPNRFRSSWYLSDSGGVVGMYLHGPQINPAPVNGHHYREFLVNEPMNTRAPYVLRYNDDAHSWSRAVADNPWTIVRGGNVMAPLTDIEVQRMLPPEMYVEIQWTAPVTGATDEEIDDIFTDEEAEEAPAPAVETPVVSAPHNRLRGVGAADDGVVVLDPPLVEGQAYLVWDTTRDYYDTRTPAGFLMPDGRNITIVGYYTDRYGVIEWVDDLYQGEMDTQRNDVHWAKLATQAHEENDDESEARVAALLAQRETEFNELEALNTRLNILADEQSWCGDYESAMGRIGMRSRRGSNPLAFNPGVATVNVPERHAWRVDVDVTFSGEIDYIRGGLEGEIESAAGFNGSVSSVRFDATASVTIESVIADDEDSARAQIDTDMVENAMDNAGITYSDIEHWTVDDVNEDDDFDWGSYDD